MRIALISDSTSFWVRPETEGAASYSKLLMDAYSVTMYAKPGMSFRDVPECLWSQILPNNYDAIVIALGVNDVFPRLLGYDFSKFMNRSPFSYRTSLEFARIVLRIFSRGRFIAKFYRIGLSFSWIQKKRRRKFLTKCIALASECTSGTVLVIAIAETSDRILKIFPGLNQEIKKFNDDLRAACAIDNCIFLDVNEELSGNWETVIPEGVHYSQMAHAQLSLLISRHLV